MTVRSFTNHTRIDLPEDRLDLPTWLFQLVDADYPEASDAHRALGTWARGGVRGMINVESIGGHLFVQHYTEQSAVPSKVVLDSPASTMYLLHTVPAKVGVKWIMWVTPDGEDGVQFHCTVQVTMPLLLAVVGGLIGSFRAVQRHVDEECVGYARSLEQYSRATAAATGRARA